MIATGFTQVCAASRNAIDKHHSPKLALTAVAAGAGLWDPGADGAGCCRRGEPLLQLGLLSVGELVGVGGIAAVSYWAH